MLDQISVVIITRNAAATLADTLESTRSFAEVVVYDNGSNDATMQIAQAYENVSLLLQAGFTAFLIAPLPPLTGASCGLGLALRRFAK